MSWALIGGDGKGNEFYESQQWDFRFEGEFPELSPIEKCIDVLQSKEDPKLYKVIFAAMRNREDAEAWITEHGGTIVEPPDLLEQLFGPR